MNDEDAQDTILLFAGWELRPRPLALFRAGTRVPIQRQPLKLLAHLVGARGDIVTHAQIRALLWANLHVDFARGTHVCIRQIRTVLGEDAGLIESVPGEGYRFAGEVSVRRQTAPGLMKLHRHAPAALVTAAVGAVGAAVVALLSEIGTPPAAPPDSYLRAAYLLEQPGAEAAERSLRYFAQAQVEVPDYAPAFVGAAQANLRLGDHVDAKRMAEAALKAGSDSAEPHLILGRIALRDWDWKVAEQRFTAALSREEAAEAHHGLATVSRLAGDIPRAERHMARAYALDPASTLIVADYGWMELVAGRAGRAVALCEEALDLDPASLDARICLVRANQVLAREHEVAAHAAAVMSRSGAPPVEIAAVVGAVDKAAAFERWRLARYSNPRRSEAVSPVLLAALNAYLGDEARALDLLERALQVRDAALPLVLTDPAFRGLHGNERFLAVVRRSGIRLA